MATDCILMVGATIGLPTDFLGKTVKGTQAFDRGALILPALLAVQDILLLFKEPIKRIRLCPSTSSTRLESAL